MADGIRDWCSLPSRSSHSRKTFPVSEPPPCANRISPTFNEADFTKVWKSKESNLVVAVTAMGRPHVHKAVLRWDRRKKGGHSLK